MRASDALLLARYADLEALGMDELDVVHAEKCEEVANVGRLGIARGSGVQTTARRKDVHLLARQQADGSLLRVAECGSGAGDVIEIRLERRRQAEVVHRQAEHDDLGAPELVDQGVGMLDHRLLRSAVLAGLREERAEARRVEMWHRLEREVAHDHLTARVRLAPGSDEALSEAARLAAVGEDAGPDLQKRFHCLPR